MLLGVYVRKHGKTWRRAKKAVREYRNLAFSYAEPYYVERVGDEIHGIMSN